MIEQSLLIPLKNQDIISEHTFSIGSLLIDLIYNTLLVLNYLVSTLSSILLTSSI